MISLVMSNISVYKYVFHLFFFLQKIQFPPAFRNYIAIQHIRNIEMKIWANVFVEGSQAS